MLVYQATKSEFMDHVDRDVIVERISDAFRQRVHRPADNEVRSWRNSMQYMYKVLNTDRIPATCGVAIEFGVPYTGSRIDFLLTGRESAADESAVIIELKQWDKLETVDGKDGIVRTFVGGGHREVSHPSYQAWSYARMIEDYNEAVRDAQVVMQPCAYLHNYSLVANDPLLDPRYGEHLEKAPAFCSGDVPRLRDFICGRIKLGDDGEVLYRIESGKLRPSKSLQDALTGMLAGNDEFVMIDDQKVVFETALELARQSHTTGRKNVLIVRGGPGTGKSVVAVNLLVRLTAEDMVCQYVSKNSAPRHVYSRLLQAHHKKAFIQNLFKNSGAYLEAPRNGFDALVVDEAHRLNEKSGMFKNLGENQIAEIVDASKFSVFFIDENQRVTIKDIGTVDDIRQLAKRAGGDVYETSLNSQFRCNGSDSYLEWLDDAIGIQPAENGRTPNLDYDFRVFDDPNEMFAAIALENARNNKSRVVAGYCWEWPTASKGDPDRHDVAIPEWGFAKSWNLDTTTTWAIDPDSVHQIGCIHTAQGLEFDYVGVIIGDDMRLEDGRVVTARTSRAKSDQSLRGLKEIEKEDPARAQRLADEMIRNTYRVLMTRGLKGCFVFCTDPALVEYFRMQMPRTYTPALRNPLLAAEDHPAE